MKMLSLEALDTLFFRDGKPFSMGEETWAEGIFPPHPSTLYGMLRSVYFAHHLDKLSGVNTAMDPTQDFVIESFCLEIAQKPVFLGPFDAFRYGKDNHGKLFELAPVSSSIVSDFPFTYLLQTTQTGKIATLGEKKDLLTLEQFNQYLAGKDTFDYLPLGDYLTDEPKIGIGREFSTRTTSEGKLYRVEMKRLEGKRQAGINNSTKLNLLVGFEGIQGFPQGSGIARFGAENKAVTYADAADFVVPYHLDDKDEYLKIYLATPAIFTDGLYPLSWFESNGLELIAVANGRVLPIGGFYIKGKGTSNRPYPKPMYRAVPAGSVYYCKIEKGSQDTWKEKIHEGSIYNLAPLEDAQAKDWKKQGFGLTYVGKCSPKN